MHAHAHAYAIRTHAQIHIHTHTHTHTCLLRSLPGLRNKCCKCSKPPKKHFKKAKAIFFLFVQKTFFFQPKVKIAIQNISENPENKDFQDIFSGFCQNFQDFAGFFRILPDFSGFTGFFTFFRTLACLI